MFFMWLFEWAKVWHLLKGFFSDYFWLSMRGFLCVLIPVQSLTFFALRFFMWLFVWQKFDIFCKAYSDHLCAFWYQSKVWNMLCPGFIRIIVGLPWVVSCLSSYRSKVWIFLWSGIIRNVFFSCDFLREQNFDIFCAQGLFWGAAGGCSHCTFHQTALRGGRWTVQVISKEVKKCQKTCQQNKCEKVSMEDVDSKGTFKSVPKSVIKKSSKSVNKISV